MIEQLKSVSITELTAIIMALTSFIGLFIYNRQAKIAERGLNVKINEVAELTRKIQEESKERERLHKLHEKEKIDRLLGEARIQNQANDMNRLKDEQEYFKEVSDHADKVAYIYVNYYYFFLLRDICLTIEEVLGRNFYNTEIKEDLLKVFNYFQINMEIENFEQERKDKYRENWKKYEEKRGKYDFNNMNSDKVEGIFKVINNELEEGYDKINKEQEEYLKIKSENFRLARIEIVEIIKRIFDKLNNQNEEGNNEID